MITMDITLLIQIVNMVILMFLLNGVLYKPVKKILKDRAERQQGMQGEIAKFEKNARLRQQEVDEKMAKASGKAKAALDSTRAEAQAAGDQRLGAIKAEAEEGKNRQLAEIKAQIDSARAGLKANLDGFANDMASKILGRSL
ncbi:ATP synthase F0 subunit B [Desulfoprunum benzoelyticum]|jgi:F-type H+-transporting ATPase subunit b|uniref:ATP synthase subunit b n=1 Tax=Desulfoprunum benzoelyticum TaxID=1506996 RepID=A0A840UU64_9BACT|nr:ATP synthase F0 subunit B [Desulfoprunum benzoelyticum]MBB5346934.1 F-type H+-transporting ATPase subunit b [Desulfoprunum benzoelyticum]MBM9529404.1 ATP synthase F0 subunit B [Desulfoprunum benzoelyticum]